MALALLLTGCVTVVVPTATPIPPTPTPRPSPLILQGAAGTYAGAMSITFPLAAGDYVANWSVTGANCTVSLRLQQMDGDKWETDLATLKTVSNMTDPVSLPPINGVPAGTYAILSVTSCPWTVALGQYA